MTHYGAQQYRQQCDQAMAWVARLRADRVSDDDRRAFALWLASDRAHRRAMDEVLDLWEDLAVVQALPFDEETYRDRGRNRRWLLGTAAALAACLVVAVALWPGSQNTTQLQLQTAVGEQHSFELPDQSRLTLNTGSRANVSYGDAERHVELIRGEAYFEVAKDPKRPFNVDAGSARATAVGTAFNIRRDGDLAAITVTEGVVRVTELGTTGNRVPAADLLRVDQRVVAGPAGLERSATVDTAPLVAWRKGELLARDMTLAELTRELERYWDTHILLGDNDLATRTVSGVFRLEQPDAMLNAVARSLDLEVVRLDDRTVQLLAVQR